MGRNLRHVCRSMGGAVFLPLVCPPEDMSSSLRNGLAAASALARCHLRPLSIVLHLRGGSAGRGAARHAAPCPSNQLRRHQPPSITGGKPDPVHPRSPRGGRLEGHSAAGRTRVWLMSSGFGLVFSGVLRRGPQVCGRDPRLAPSRHAGPVCAPVKGSSVRPRAADNVDIHAFVLTEAPAGPRHSHAARHVVLGSRWHVRTRTSRW